MLVGELLDGVVGGLGQQPLLEAFHVSLHLWVGAHLQPVPCQLEALAQQGKQLCAR